MAHKAACNPVAKNTCKYALSVCKNVHLIKAVSVICSFKHIQIFSLWRETHKVMWFRKILVIVSQWKQVWHYCFFFFTAYHLSQIQFYSWLLFSQDLAEHLVIHGHCLNSTDHKELSSLFNLGQESSRWAMDRRVALAIANLDIPQNWNVLGSHSGDGESWIILSCRKGIPVLMCGSKGW